MGAATGCHAQLHTLKIVFHTTAAAENLLQFAFVY